jgi:hypothetical protein
MVFPMVGRFMFNGGMVVVLVLTLVFGFAMAAVSYALVESPCRNAFRRWEYRRAGDRRSPVPIPPLDSSVSDAPEPVVAQCLLAHRGASRLAGVVAQRVSTNSTVRGTL